MPRTEYHWSGHGLFGRIAYDMLPEWEKEVIQPDMSPECLGKSYLPSCIEGVRDKVGYLCHVMDLVYYDECRPYATLPDGRWIPHCPPDEMGQAASSTGAKTSPLASTQVTELLMARMVDAIRANDWEVAVHHGGALAHYLQEPFTPGHAVDNNLFHELFPDPDPERHIRLHYAFDCATDRFEPLPVKLMGTSIPEASFRLQIELDRGIREGKQYIRPVIESVYAGEPAEARQAILAPQSQKATWITSCAWHTALCIAFERFDSVEVEALAKLDMTQMIPYFWHTCQYFELLPGRLVQEHTKIPIHVWDANPNGAKVEREVARGFGMGGYMGVKFFVNGDVYNRFTCRVGLPSRQTEGQDAHTDTRFAVEVDSGLNNVYSEEIEYRATRIAERQLRPGAPVQSMHVDITGARTLILLAKSEPYTDATTGEVRWSIPHVAVCEPTLHRGARG